MEKSQQSANSCRVPQQHLQGFKTWNDFVSACEIPDLSKTRWSNPDLPTFTFIVLSQYGGTQSQEPRFIKYEAACMFWTVSRHQEAGALLLTALHCSVSNLPTELTSDTLILQTRSNGKLPNGTNFTSCRLQKHYCFSICRSLLNMFVTLKMSCTVWF